jgi:thioredoxin 1
MPKDFKMPKEISKKEFNNKVFTSSSLSIVKFRTKWSGACQIIEPVYNELARSYNGIADFYTVDVEKEKALEKMYGVTELPTILFFKSGIVIDHAVGLSSKNLLIEKIEKALAES